MKKMMRRLTSGGLALAGMLCLASRAQAQATASATLNIAVTVIANLSVNVRSVVSSTDTTSWNTGAQAFLVSATTAVVTNDSGAQTEKWGLSTLSSSIDQGVLGSWTLAGSLGAVGTDSYAVQAVFGDSGTGLNGCPSAGAGDWSAAFAPVLTAGAPVTYTSTVFADTQLGAGFNPDVSSGAGNGRMLANSKRALCWRVKTPQTTSTVDAQTIMVIVSALNP